MRRLLERERFLTTALKGLAARKLAALALLVLMAVICSAAMAPILAPHDPLDQNLSERLRPPAWPTRESQEFLLGTDALGRDILSRLIYGARISLVVSGSAVAVSAVVGVTAGMVAAIFGGWVDDVITRLIDIQLAIPYMLLAVTLSMVLGGSTLSLVGVLVLRGWVLYARVVRGNALSLKQREFVLSAEAIGAGPWRIVFRHILPNVIGIAIVLATLDMSNMILLESALSFLGLGVPAPAPSWGRSLSAGRTYITSAWWLVTLPGLAITLTTLSINLVGDWLRDILDPMRRIGP